MHVATERRATDMQGVAVFQNATETLASYQRSTGKPLDFQHLGVFENGHGAWHSLYIGLGFERNPFGLQYLDAFGVRYVESVDPKTAPGTHAYYAALKRRYLKIARSHPGFVARTTSRKGLVVLRDGLESVTPSKFAEKHKKLDGFLPSTPIPLLIIVLPIALFWGAGAREFRRRLLIAAPAGATTLMTPSLVVPYEIYEVAFSMWVAFVTLLCICSIAATATEPDRMAAWRALGDRSSLRRLANRRVLAVLAVSALGLLAFLLLRPATDRIRESADTHAFGASAARPQRPAGALPPAVLTWNLVGGLPAGWEPRVPQLEPSRHSATGSFLKPRRRRVRTNSGRP